MRLSIKLKLGLAFGLVMGAAAKAPSRNAVAAQQARAQGFALDLSHGGPDADDDKFREYA